LMAGGRRKTSHVDWKIRKQPSALHTTWNEAKHNQGITQTTIGSIQKRNSDAKNAGPRRKIEPWLDGDGGGQSPPKITSGEKARKTIDGGTRNQGLGGGRASIT